MSVFKHIFNNFRLLTKKQKAVIIGLFTFLFFPFLYSIGLLPALDLFYVNHTRSAPLGVYVAAKDQRLHLGDYIIMTVPEEMKPYIYGRGWSKEKYLLKQVAGISLDMYEVKENTISINGKTVKIQPVDHENLPLPKPANGKYRIPLGNFMPISLDRDNSFDARYTGPLRQSLIVTKVVPFITLPLWLENYL